ncbi:MAG: ATPase [Gammaproteobacteria bacterium]|nr:ATPase [Gammaproteobacteria bacterium]
MDSNVTIQRPLYLGIDGGGSKCKATILDANDNLLGTGIAGPANPFQNYQQTIISIVESAQLALSDTNLANSELNQLIAGIGLAGVNVPSIFNKMSQWQHPFAQMYLTTDLHIACLGAHQGLDGAIMITGTGSCGYSYIDGQATIIGAHGFPHGDKGSGAWFGLQAVKNVLLSLDGIEEPSLMNQAMLAHLECRTGLDLVEAVAKKPATFYAQLAFLVFDAAVNKDSLALTIIEDGASYISTVGRQLCDKHSFRMSMIGGLSNKIFAYLDQDVQYKLSLALRAPEFGAVIYAKQQTPLGR